MLPQGEIMVCKASRSAQYSLQQHRADRCNTPTSRRECSVWSEEQRAGISWANRATASQWSSKEDVEGHLHRRLGVLPQLFHKLEQAALFRRVEVMFITKITGIPVPPNPTIQS